MVDADRLMGRAEIEQLLGVGYTRVRAIMARPSFPRPLRELTGMKIWDGAEVEAWAAEHRKPKLAEDPEGDT
jgi:predicted DNA-binding transcriptional regulator AlpA